MRDRKQPKIAAKKLQLKAEILRKLNEEQLAEVMGGAAPICKVSDCCCTGTVPC
jgi:hypothetical protein